MSGGDAARSCPIDGYFVEFSFPPYRIAVTIPDTDALLHAVRAHLSARRGFALATINLDHLVKLRRDPAFRSAYAAQDMVCADGNPIVWLSRLAGRPVSLVPGSDMVIPLARLAAREGVAIALMGSTPETLRDAAAYLQGQIPGLRVAATIAPAMGFDPAGPAAERIVDSLAESGAGLVFVALGAPKQEIFAALGRRRAPHLGFASIGAGLDFFTGRQVRAPLWVRRIAIEWAWRMLQNPRRLAKRYAESALILPGEAMKALRQRRPD